MSNTPMHPEAGSGLFRRLWLYQVERFPIFKTALLLAVFSAASISVSAHLGERSLPPISTIIAVWLVTFIIFFQMRACDEWKDLEDDQNFRPERPIPSGLVTLRLIAMIALSGAFVAIFLVVNISITLLLPLALVWLWLGLMTFEFFVPEWLKVRPVLYLLSHMAIMPIIDLFITSAEWMQHGSHPPPALALFLALSFANGCVIEIGRKVWAPENERKGVETYSSLLGPTRAAWIWAGMSLFAWFLLAGVGYSVDAPFAVAGPGLVALGVVWFVAKKFVTKPTPANEKAIETIAGLWVFVCYCLAGFAPFIAKWVSS